MKALKQIELNIDEICELLERLQSKSLLDEDYETLQAALEVTIALNNAVKQKEVSIKRLLKRIFGIKTEKRKKILKKKKTNKNGSSSPENSSSDKDENQNPSESKAASPDDSKSPTDKDENQNNDSEELKPKPKPKGHGRNGADKFTGAERKQIPHPELKHGDPCPVCPKGKTYKEKKPALTLILTGAAPVQAAILERERLRCNACGAVFTANIPDDADSSIKGSRQYEASAKAAIPVYKYGFGMPFYRISKLQEMVGVPLAPATLWDKTEELANTVHPVYLELVRQAAQGKVFHNDDTTMPVLSLIKENEDKTNKERTGMFTTGIVSILEDGTTIALFYTGRNHAGENLDNLQKLRDSGKAPPVQMCDALSRNTNDNFERIVGHCLTHARRSFVDIISVFPDECEFVIDTLAKVYKNDAVTKEQGMSDEDRLSYHKEHSTSHMESLHNWMDEQIEDRQVEPNSVLGKAISYMLKYWPELTLFLKVAGAPLDNNICEQILKRAVLHRKNAMFYKNDIGACIGDLFMGIIHTCYLMKVNPMEYLITLQTYESHIKNDPQKWMPWNYKETVSKIKDETIVI